MNRRFVAVIGALLPLLLGCPPVRAQWVPSGPLAAVLVVQDCTETGGDVAVSRLDPPTVYLCPTVVRLVRKKDGYASLLSRRSCVNSRPSIRGFA